MHAILLTALLAPSPEYHPAHVHFAERINATREARGLPPCEIDPQLMEGCRRWSKHMATRGRMYHARGGGAEIIAYSGAHRNRWPGTAIGMWLRSGGHRRIMLGGYKRMGCAVVRRGNVHYFTARFR